MSAPLIEETGDRESSLMLVHSSDAHGGQDHGAQLGSSAWITGTSLLPPVALLYQEIGSRSLAANPYNSWWDAGVLPSIVSTSLNALCNHFPVFLVLSAFPVCSMLSSEC